MTSKAPPSSSLKPPTGGDNTKYVLVVLLLGAGLGALLFWKSCANKPQPVTLNAVPSNIPSAMPTKEDDVPPPPPIEEVKEGGTTHTSSGNPCNVASCGGKTTGDLEAALAFRAKQAHRCYDTALTQDPTLQGHLKIAVRVGGNGAVCNASVVSNDLANGSVANCIANMFRMSGHFPPPHGGCVDANVPIALLPPGQR